MYKIPADERLEQRAAKLKRFAAPYSLGEMVGIIRRNFSGVNRKKNAGIVAPAPRTMPIDETLSPNLKIGFIGDIMDLSSKSLTYGPRLRDFLGACDLLVGNFEATIHHQKKRDGTWWGTPQPQAERIIEDLAGLFPPEKFFLSLANNHSGDYTKSVFDRSCRLLTDAGFPLFGMRGTPFIDIHESVRIVTGTMWSNQIADDVLYLPEAENIAQLTRGGAVNVMYPHWGYELEAYPRQFIVDLAERYADDFDAVIGHHAHNPQPVTWLKNKPVAFGLGDFCYHYNLPTYKFGLIARLNVHTDGPKGKVTSFDWQMIENHHTDDTITVELRDRHPGWLCADQASR